MKGAWRLSDYIIESCTSCGRGDEEDYNDILWMDMGSTEVEGKSKLAVERVMAVGSTAVSRWSRGNDRIGLTRRHFFLFGIDYCASRGKEPHAALRFGYRII